MARRRKKASAVTESEVVMTDETQETTESSKSESEGSTESTSTNIGVETTGEVLRGEDVSSSSSDSEGTESTIETVVETVAVAVTPEVSKPKAKKEIFKPEPKAAEPFSAPKPSFPPAHEKQVKGKTVQINSAWTS